MPTVIEELMLSDVPLENDLAQVMLHWQKQRRSEGKSKGLGYEPRDIRELGAEETISRRVLNASSGFEEVDPDQSYEAIVLRYSERFPLEVIRAAEQRLLGAGKLEEFNQQDIQFFVKSSSIELFGEAGLKLSNESWLDRPARLPELHKGSGYAEPMLSRRFRCLVWLHEQEKGGERGRGLSAVVEFEPICEDRTARVRDIELFEHPVGRELLASHKGDGSFISQIDAKRHSRLWAISETDVDEMLSAIREKARMIADFENPDPDPGNVDAKDEIENETVLRAVIQRRNQAAFRRALLQDRGKCAVTGTREFSVLDAAHIVPYAGRSAHRDNPNNGLLLRSDIHKLFDRHLISINPTSRMVEISDRVKCPSYLGLKGAPITDQVWPKSLEYHYEKFRKTNGL